MVSTGGTVAPGAQRPYHILPTALVRAWVELKVVDGDRDVMRVSGARLGACARESTLKRPRVTVRAWHCRLMLDLLPQHHTKCAHDK